MFTRKNLIYLVVLLILSFIVALSNYVRIPIATFNDGFAYLMHGGVLLCAIFGVLYMLSINKYFFGLFFPIVSILYLLTAYFLYVYNVTITAAVIDVFLNTDWYLSLEFVSSEMVIEISIIILVLCAFIIYRIKSQDLFHKHYSIHLALASCLIIPSVVVNNLRANTIINRVPFTIIGASDEYIKLTKLNSTPRKEVGLDAVSMTNDSLLVVLIVGEAVRNDHLGFNGYSRNTTPLLSSKHIISFPNTRSLSTYTAASVPQLLTRADSISPFKAYEEESFISILKRCNYSTAWIANQTPDYTYDGLVKEAEVFKNVSVASSLYSDKKWTDGLILPVFSEIIEDLGSRQFVGLHTIGSHWYYNYRYPDSFMKFMPVTQSRSIRHNTKDEIINSYDNSILFMDYFISNIISMIDDRNSILIYVSDHGELLGEEQMWLHASEHDVLYNSACFIWMSDEYKKLNPDKFKSALANSKESYTTSLLFHTILSACNINTSVLKEKLNLLNREDSTKTDG